MKINKKKKKRRKKYNVISPIFLHNKIEGCAIFSYPQEPIIFFQLHNIFSLPDRMRIIFFWTLEAASTPTKAYSRKKKPRYIKAHWEQNRGSRGERQDLFVSSEKSIFYFAVCRYRIFNGNGRRINYIGDVMYRKNLINNPTRVAYIHKFDLMEYLYGRSYIWMHIILHID